MWPAGLPPVAVEQLGNTVVNPEKTGLEKLQPARGEEAVGLPPQAGPYQMHV